MKKQLLIIGLVLLTPLLGLAQTIVTTSDASTFENQAAQEVRRYIFLRTGTAPTISVADSYGDAPSGDIIIVATDTRDIITELKTNYGSVDAPDSDNRLGYLIKSFPLDGRNVLVITGADGTDVADSDVVDHAATLYGAYRFAELIGCYFNLAGDVVPDVKISYPIDISSYDEKSQPWYKLRGCEPFHNFIAGPDLWNAADYHSFMNQQVKMGFNFFGLHYYAELDENNAGNEGPEPHVWIGHKNDVNPDGTVKDEGAYASFWGSSNRPYPHQWNSPVSCKPADFTAGAQKLFEFEEAGSDVIPYPSPQTPAEKAAVFNDVGEFLNVAFSHAKQMGITTVLGTSANMGYIDGILGSDEDSYIFNPDIHSCPPDIRTRMRDVYEFTLPTAIGAENEAFSKTLYEGIFTRIARTHPLDYYWLWTVETLTYSGDPLVNSTRQSVINDFKYCNEVMTETCAPFKMATYGWTSDLEMEGSSTTLRGSLPTNVAMGSLSEGSGGKQEIMDAGHEYWGGVWYEEDWGLMQLQLRATSTWNSQEEAIGAAASIAKHWRTNSVAHASSQHSKIVWDNRGLVSETLDGTSAAASRYPNAQMWRDNPLDNITEQDSDAPEFVEWINNYHIEWARTNFGDNVAVGIGSLMAYAERLGEPKAVGPGVVQGGVPKTAKFLPSAAMEIWPEDGWFAFETDPGFDDAFYLYDQFFTYKDDIVGKGNIDRYMYWYHFFKGQLEMNKMSRGLHIASQEGSPDYGYTAGQVAQAKLDVISGWESFITHEIQRVRNVSELSIIAQAHSSILKSQFITDLDESDLATPTTDYAGEKSVRAMPEVTQIYTTETFEQKVIFIGDGAITNPTLYYRTMGSGGFTAKPLEAIPGSVNDNIMKAILADPGYDFEYYIKGSIGGDEVVYPVTGGDQAADINKSVIRTQKTYVFEPQELCPPLSSKDFKLIEPADVLVYPNPTTGPLTVKLKIEDKIEVVKVYNISGQIVLQDDSPSGTINIGSFATGIYFVEIQTEGKVGYAKVVKQ